MKKFILTLLVLVLAMTSFAFGASEFDEVWLVTADTTAKGAAGQVFVQLVQEKVKAANAGLVIDYFPNGELEGLHCNHALPDCAGCVIHSGDGSI